VKTLNAILWIIFGLPIALILQVLLIVFEFIPSIIHYLFFPDLDGFLWVLTFVIGEWHDRYLEILGKKPIPGVIYYDSSKRGYN